MTNTSENNRTQDALNARVSASLRQPIEKAAGQIGIILANRSWLRPFLTIVVALWLIVASFPLVPAYAAPGLDGSWVLGLGMAHAQGLVHGRDIIFTYGPLAFLSVPDSVTAPLGWTFAYHLGLYFLWAAALLRLAICPRNQAPIWSVLLVGTVALVAPGVKVDHLELAFFTIAALSLLETGYWRIVELVLLAFLASVACLVKVSLGIQLAVLLFCVLAVLYQQWRLKLPLFATAACLPIFTFGLYCLASGSPGSFPAYVNNALRIATGFADSMGSPGPASQVAFAVASIVVLFLVLPLLANNLIELALGFLPALASAFFFFKNAMVRQDGHALAFQVMLALASLFFLVTVRTVRYRQALIGFQAISIAVGYLYISHSFPRTGSDLRQRLTLQIGGRIGDFVHGQETWSSLNRQTESALAGLRLNREYSEAIGKGSVDAIPWEIAQVRANHWNWQPSPILQAYSAYTPALDQINAEHSREHGADFLLVTWESIDGRHSFFEEPLSWQAMLDRYRSDFSNGTRLLMRRASTSRFSDHEEVSSSMTHWNEKTPVPQGYSPLVLSAGVRKNLLGSSAALLFRLSPVWIEVTRKSGQTVRYRAVPDNLPSGVIVNPLPGNLTELNLFGRPGCASADPVVSLRFVAGNTWEFHDEIPLQWSHVRERNTSGNSGSCLVVEPSRTQFLSWGGVGQLTIAAGAGEQSPNVQSAADWLSVAPPAKGPGSAPLYFGLRANPLSESRRGEISVGNFGIAITQGGIPGDEVPRSVELGLFNPGGSAPQAPSSAPNYSVVVDSLTFPGQPGGQGVMGDWTGTGVVRMGVYRNGWWYLDLNNNGKWDGVEGGDGLYAFGMPGDKAVVGDWTGDGITKLGVFRQGLWVLDANNNHQFDPADPSFEYGMSGDLPAVGKWKPGSKVDQVGIFRRGSWVLDSYGTRAYQLTDTQYHFGTDGDLPVVSRSRSRIGVYRRGTWILDMNGSGRFEPASPLIPYGSLADQPLIGEW